MIKGDGQEGASGGLIFSLVGKKTETEIDVLWGRVKAQGTAKMTFPHTVTLPCGSFAVFDDAEHIQGLGTSDIRCKCGEHYIVKFKDKREEVTDDDSGSGTGESDSDSGSPDTGKPKQSPKPKAKRKTRKRAKKVL